MPSPDDAAGTTRRGETRQPVHLLQSPPRQDARHADPCIMVIFGAGGDLTKRLIVPALYNLSLGGLLPENFALVAVDHADETAGTWCEEVRDALEGFTDDPNAEFDIDKVDDAAWSRLLRNVRYLRADLTDPDAYHDLREVIGETDRTCDTGGNVIFYLAVGDQLFGTVVDGIGDAGLADRQREDRHGEDRQKAGPWRRVVIEKPFGHGLGSARELNARVRRTLDERQIYRIDHFVGKDTVQSIMAFRFANGLFEPVWNRDRIDHVQITAAETIGVGSRGSFYEATGALRDMVPSHLFTLLSMVAMEPPAGFDAEEVRDRKLELFRAMPAIAPGNAVRGQYGAGRVADRSVPAYRGEPGVAGDSAVETYVALEARIDNPRWAGVPFYLRTGKRMGARNTEIAIQFKPAPYDAFRNTPVDALRPNWLVLSIAPVEGISLQFEIRRPGPAMDLAAVRMDFHYEDWFPEEENVGYETLLHDVMTGDQTRFMRADMVEQTWRIVQPVLDAWDGSDAADPPVYPAGSAGPGAAEDLLTDRGRSWRAIDPDEER